MLPGVKCVVNRVLNFETAYNKGFNSRVIFDNHHEDFESKVNCIDVGATKVDNEKDELKKNPSTTRDSLISNITKFNESRDTQEVGRVEAPHTQYCKPPLWTCRTHLDSSSHGQKSKHISGNKREATPAFREDEPVLKR